MRVWIDISNSPQVPFFRPLIALLRERGHDVDVTTREYAQTVELLAAARHRARGRRPRARRSGRRRARRARWPGRLRAFEAIREATPLRPRPLARVARAAARRPLARHPLGLRVRLRARSRPSTGSAAAQRRASSSPRRFRRIGSTASAPARGRCGGTRASRRSTTSTDSSPTTRCSTSLGLDRERILVVVRTPPEVSLYHRHGNPLFAEVLERLGRDDAVHAVVLPRTVEQRERDPRARAAVSRRARARDRRAEPRRARRSRRVGRRDDEPRGGRARRSGLHDVCGSAGRGGQSSRERRTTAGPDLGRTRSWSRSGAARARAVERDPRSSSTSALGARAVARPSRSG